MTTDVVGVRPQWGAVELEQGMHLGALAGFANPAQVGQSGLAVADSARLRRDDPDLLLDTLLVLATQDRRYRAQALADSGKQVVREWRRIVREGATCLDIALIVAAQLLECDLRPHLALRFGGGRTHLDNHAFLLVRPSDQRTLAAELPPGAVALGRDGVAEWEPPGALADGWVAIDPTALLRDEAAAVPVDHEGAALVVAQAAAMTAMALPGRFYLVDVSAAQSTEQGAVRELPRPDLPGGLTLRRPPTADFRRWASRVEVRCRLAAAEGTVVLTGPSGRGKSLLALDVVRSDLSWVLNASSKEALRSSLAEQEGVERGLPAAAIASDVEAYADAALDRLHGSLTPWTVVVDNANLAPDVLSRYLPRPDVLRGHKVVVTTTEGDLWREEGGATVLEVEPLSADEVWAAVTDRPGARSPADGTVARLDGRPLLAAALQKLGRAGHADQLDDILAADAPAAAFWAAVRATGDRGEHEAAHLASLLPADGVPSAIYHHLLGPNGGDALSSLASRGLLERTGDRWTMHRLFAEAVRDDEEGRSTRSELARRLGGDDRAVDFLARSYDPGVLDRLREVLVRESVQDESCGRALVGVASVYDARSTAQLAAATSEVALEMLDGDSDPRLRATCLLGVARRVNQKSDPDVREIPAAIAQATEARELAERAQDRGLAAKSLAMEGLLIKRAAGFLEGQAKRDELLEAYRRITEARKMREALFADDPLNLELAKARFNMGGIGIELAKEFPEDRARYLADAEWGYQRALDARHGAFGSMSHRHVASCTSGLGMVAYYRAVLGGRDDECTSAALRNATTTLIDALKAREHLEPVDDNDALKTLRLLAKTVLMRIVANEVEAGKVAVLDDGAMSPRKVLADYRTELGWSQLALACEGDD